MASIKSQFVLIAGFFNAYFDHLFTYFDSREDVYYEFLRTFNGVGKQEQECIDLSGSTVRPTTIMKILVLDFRSGTEIARTESEEKATFEGESGLFLTLGLGTS